MPCSTPIRLTSSTHRQLSSEMLSMPPARGDTGIVADHMDISERLVRGFRRALDADGIGDVASDRRAHWAQIRAGFLTASAKASVSISASITFMPAWAKAAPERKTRYRWPRPSRNAVLPASSRMIDCPRYLRIATEACRLLLA